MPLRVLLALCFAALLTGCGFHLRGNSSGNLPYKTMYIALPETADVRIWMERYIKATGQTEIVDQATQADATFQQVSDTPAKEHSQRQCQGPRP